MLSLASSHLIKKEKTSVIKLDGMRISRVLNFFHSPPSVSIQMILSVRVCPSIEQIKMQRQTLPANILLSITPVMQSRGC